MRDTMAAYGREVLVQDIELCSNYLVCGKDAATGGKCIGCGMNSWSKGTDLRFSVTHDDCPICLEHPGKQHVLLDCGHTICAACFRMDAVRVPYPAQPDPCDFGCPPSEGDDEDRAYEAWVSSEHEDSALLRAGRDAWNKAFDAWEDRCAAIDMAEHRLTKCPLCRHPILWNSDKRISGLYHG